MGSRGSDSSPARKSSLIGSLGSDDIEKCCCCG